MASVSIITLTRDRMQKLQRCLKHLIPQLMAGDEILVVDTGSNDGTSEHFSKWRQMGVRCVLCDGEGSWAQIRNFGERAARGSIITFLDDDCVPCDGWLERGRAAIAEADAVGGTVQPTGVGAFPSWWHPEMGWMVG